MPITVSSACHCFYRPCFPLVASSDTPGEWLMYSCPPSSTGIYYYYYYYYYYCYCYYYLKNLTLKAGQIGQTRRSTGTLTRAIKQPHGICSLIVHVFKRVQYGHAAFLIHVGTLQLPRHILTYIERKHYHVGKKLPTSVLYGTRYFISSQ